MCGSGGRSGTDGSTSTPVERKGNLQIQAKKRKNKHQCCLRHAGKTDLPALQPDVLQLIIHSAVTAQTGKEAPEIGST